MVNSLTKPSALIIGCGDIGNRLGTRLLDKGFHVWGMRRNTDALLACIFPIKGDLRSEMTLGNWPEKPIDYVIYCAAASEHNETEYKQAYLHGMRHVLNKLKLADYHIKRFFFTSSTGVYHQFQGEWVDETSETRPVSMAGRIMLATERLVHASTLSSTVIRFGGIYGPGRDYLLNRVRKGEGYSAGRAVYGNRIHSEDCAGILEYLIECDQEGRVVDNCYLGVDCSPVSLCEVTDWLAQQMDVTISRFVALKRRGSKRCCNQKIIDAGYRFMFPDYKAGYGALI